MKIVVIASLLLLQAPQAVFRSRVSFVEIDVSVLDRDHRPVRALTAADFTVFEDGVPQKIETFAEISLPAPSAAPAVWWDEVPDGSATNVGATEGSLLALVVDDEGLSPASATAVKRIARAIVARMSRDDRMAVYFTLVNGSSQEATQDRSLIVAAIDRFIPALIAPQLLGPNPGDTRRGGDRPQRAPVTSKSCAGVVDMLSEFARLAGAYPGRRKAAFVISERIPGLAPGTCFDAMLALYDHARRANLNVYPINPRGLTGIGDAEVKTWEEALASVGQTRAEASAEHTLAANTGGLSIGQTNATGDLLDQIFVGHRSYYLLGFESSNTDRKRELRTLSVKVARDDVSIRARTAYPGGAAGKSGTVQADAPADLRGAAASFMPVSTLPMEAVAIPVAGRGGTAVIVVATIAPRLPVGQNEVNEEIEVQAVLVDPRGSVKATAARKAQARGAMVEGAVSELRIPLHLAAPPGRYQARLAARSRTSGSIGSVFVDITIPVFDREPLAFSGVALSLRRDSPVMALPYLETIFPFVPATRRVFRSDDTVSASARLYAREDAAAVSVTCRVLDATGAERWSGRLSVEGADAGSAGGALATCPVPTRGLAPGAYLLEMSARLGSRLAVVKTKFQMIL